MSISGRRWDRPRYRSPPWRRTRGAPRGGPHHGRRRPAHTGLDHPPGHFAGTESGYPYLAGQPRITSSRALSISASSISTERRTLLPSSGAAVARIRIGESTGRRGPASLHPIGTESTCYLSIGRCYQERAATASRSSWNRSWERHGGHGNRSWEPVMGRSWDVTGTGTGFGNGFRPTPCPRRTSLGARASQPRPTS